MKIYGCWVLIVLFLITCNESQDTTSEEEGALSNVLSGDFFKDSVYTPNIIPQLVSADYTILPEEKILEGAVVSDNGNGNLQNLLFVGGTEHAVKIRLKNPVETPSLDRARVLLERPTLHSDGKTHWIEALGATVVPYSTLKSVSSKSVSLDSLMQYPSQFLHRVVSVSGVQFTQPSETYAFQQSLSNCFYQLPILTSPKALFIEETVPSENGKVTGVLDMLDGRLVFRLLDEPTPSEMFNPRTICPPGTGIGTLQEPFNLERYTSLSPIPTTAWIKGYISGKTEEGTLATLYLSDTSSLEALQLAIEVSGDAEKELFEGFSEGALVALQVTNDGITSVASNFIVLKQFIFVRSHSAKVTLETSHPLQQNIHTIPIKSSHITKADITIEGEGFKLTESLDEVIPSEHLSLPLDSFEEEFVHILFTATEEGEYTGRLIIETTSSRQEIQLSASLASGDIPRYSIAEMTQIPQVPLGEIRGVITAFIDQTSFYIQDTSKQGLFLVPTEIPENLKVGSSVRVLFRNGTVHLSQFDKGLTFEGEIVNMIEDEDDAHGKPIPIELSIEDIEPKHFGSLVALQSVQFDNTPYKYLQQGLVLISDKRQTIPVSLSTQMQYKVFVPEEKGVVTGVLTTINKQPVLHLRTPSDLSKLSLPRKRYPSIVALQKEVNMGYTPLKTKITTMNELLLYNLEDKELVISTKQPFALLAEGSSQPQTELTHEINSDDMSFTYSLVYTPTYRGEEATGRVQVSVPTENIEKQIAIQAFEGVPPFIKVDNFGLSNDAPYIVLSTDRKSPFPLSIFKYIAYSNGNPYPLSISDEFTISAEKKVTISSLSVDALQAKESTMFFEFLNDNLQQHPLDSILIEQNGKVVDRAVFIIP